MLTDRNKSDLAKIIKFLSDVAKEEIVVFAFSSEVSDFLKDLGSELCRLLSYAVGPYSKDLPLTSLPIEHISKGIGDLNIILCGTKEQRAEMKQEIIGLKQQRRARLIFYNPDVLIEAVGYRFF